MDIDYNPTEEEADDVGGSLGYDKAHDRWVLTCDEHGCIAATGDSSAGGHDRTVHDWVKHLKDEHHGDGIMDADTRTMLIDPDSAL